MADSCAILFVNLPGRYELYTHLVHLHVDDEIGILYEAAKVSADVAKAAMRGHLSVDDDKNIRQQQGYFDTKSPIF